MPPRHRGFWDSAWCQKNEIVWETCTLRRQVKMQVPWLVDNGCTIKTGFQCTFSGHHIFSEWCSTNIYSNLFYSYEQFKTIKDIQARMSYYRYITGVYKSYWPGLNRYPTRNSVFKEQYEFQMYQMTKHSKLLDCIPNLVWQVSSDILLTQICHEILGRWLSNTTF